MERPIKDAAAVIARVTGVELRVVNPELPKDDPAKRKPDITLATTLLGWRPTIEFEVGLVKTVEYFKTTL